LRRAIVAFRRAVAPLREALGKVLRGDMPELRWAFGYPFALGLMLAVTAILYAVFKRRGWL
jgi:hypothetical protein